MLFFEFESQNVFKATFWAIGIYTACIKCMSHTNTHTHTFTAHHSSELEKTKKSQPCRQYPGLPGAKKGSGEPKQQVLVCPALVTAFSLLHRKAQPLKADSCPKKEGNKKYGAAM